FHNLRVLFTCASGAAYVPELQTCVSKELVDDCNDSKNRIEVTVSSNTNPSEQDDYPTIEADLNALEVPMQKSLSGDVSVSGTPRQFGCSSYCYNQGTCVLVGQRITCRCPAGFVGVRCQVAQYALNTRAVATCNATSNPCLNGGSCITAVGTIDTFAGCTCGPGWTGPLCDYPDAGGANNATTNGTTGGITLCSTNNCQNGGVCVNVTGGGIRCICPPGFTGFFCELPTGLTNIDCVTNPCQNTALVVRNLCQPNPCRNGGSCYLNETSFSCACPTGFGGTCCELALSAINPCYVNPCMNGGTCQIVNINTRRCICPSGYLGAQCEQRLCDPNPCLYGGVCLPYLNSFQCQCPPQYTGRCCELLLITTAAPNPCSSNPCQNGGTCSATSATAFVCTCTASYYGRCCEVRNFCQPNPCYNGGTCVATTNAYICQCTYPYSGSNCEMAIATRAPQPSCACILCPCPTPAPMSTNPCLPNPCQNNGGCAVVQNNPQCYCQPAFTGYYCQYTRKRSLSNAPCANVTCLNGGECHMDEKGPQCTCPKPYFGERCELINRPRTCNPSPCGRNGQCIATKDGYKCVCKNGVTGVLCEQTIMPSNHQWCSLNCPPGTTCVYEGSIPKCRVL
ncbi:unnamed protein product, partial [Adineta ricciae]